MISEWHRKGLERVQEQDALPMHDAATALSPAHGAPVSTSARVVRLGPQPPQTSWSAWLLSPAVFLLTAGATFTLFYMRTGSAEATTARTGPLFDPRAASLQMRVETEGPGLMLSWNRYSPAVEAAKDGVLQIDDGGQHREIALDRGQIINGSVFYRPASQDVSFRLDLHNREGSDIAQILRVLDAMPPKAAKEVAAAPQPKLPSPAPVRRDAPRILTAPEAANKPGARAETAATPPPLAANITPPLPDPPVISQPLAAADPAPASLQPVASPPPSLSNAQPAATATGSGNTPLARSAPVPGYVPPRPLKWIKLDEQAFGIPKLTQGVDVKVKIKIDENGHVTTAHALIDGPHRDKKLMAAASTAVRQWTFEPAKAHGVNVPCEEIIVLHLGPEAQ